MRLDYSSLILSASGWRGVFVDSGNEEDFGSAIGEQNTLLACLMAESFSAFIKQQTAKSKPKVVVATDTRPTGAAIAEAAIAALCATEIEVLYIGFSAAPETMAYSRGFDGFMYISASHNPVGHNGVKFGLNDGGVLEAKLAVALAEDFKKRCDADDASNRAEHLLTEGKSFLQTIYAQQNVLKKNALDAYTQFEKLVISGSKNTTEQEDFFDQLKKNISQNNISVVCDMNGSARTVSIDKDFLNDLGIGFYTIHNNPGEIAHEIIPEPENLVHCASLMNDLQKSGKTDAVLGYMPDCDGDRGNLVYWDNAQKEAKVLNAQEVFALCVLSETASEAKKEKLAVVVNGPTSMRIEDIAHFFGARVFRAEVGEANVVNRARELREQGYTVRILGEGSNGGNITHPAAVRDPLNTLFALLKLLVIKDIFKLWCKVSNQTEKYCDNYTLSTVIETLPSYTTTGVSEHRALAKVTTTDHTALKKAYQAVFLADWQEKRADLERDFGIVNWEAISNNGTVETRNVSDFSISGKGGLKILFTDKAGQSVAYIWMRGSGTEPVFRIICDVRALGVHAEKRLLEWHTCMIEKAQSSLA